MALTLPALLSGALVAFTIEVDNEFEHRMPHTTAAANARREPRRGPWLTSLVMWVNVLRHIDDGGTPRAEVHARARTTSDSLAGLQRWGYITVDDDVLRLTAAGRQAADVWRPLVGEVEGGRRNRFGAGSSITCAPSWPRRSPASTSSCPATSRSSSRRLAAGPRHLRPGAPRSTVTPSCRRCSPRCSWRSPWTSNGMRPSPCP